MKRRDFLKLAGLTSAVVATGGLMNMDKLLAQAPVVGSTKLETGMQSVGSHAKVYFTKKIDAKHLIMLYNLINESIYGKVAIKLHTGEKHGPNILPRDMVQALQAQIPNSTIVETNTLYQGDRYTTEGHLETLKVNGWRLSPRVLMILVGCGAEIGRAHV